MPSFPGPSLEELNKRESELLKNAAAPSTSRARTYQSNCYERFCDCYSYDYLPCSTARVATYVAYLSFFLVYWSILNYLSGLSYYLKARGHQGLDFTIFAIRQSLSGARRMCGKGRGKSVGLFPNDLLNIFETLDLTKCNHLVFWSALTLAFRCLLRASDYCYSRHAVRISDLKLVKDGLIVLIRSSKTNQFREFISEIPVFANADSLVCPVFCLKEMLSLRCPGLEEMVFKIKYKGRWRPMSANWFNSMLRKHCKIPKVSSHSLRRGGASFMLQNRHKVAEVKQRGQWKSYCVYEYLCLRTDQAMVRDKIFSICLP